MNPRSSRLLLAAAFLLAATLAAAAQAPPQPLRTAGGPAAIDAVVLYVHASLKNTDFLEPLVCALRRVLVAPVNVVDVNLPLGPDLLANPSQFDVGKIAGRFMAATAAEGGVRTFRYLLHAHDMKDAQFNFVFATSFGNATTPYHAGIVSMARLAVDDPKYSRAERADMGAKRAYNLILKSVALLAGLPNSGGCILAFPRTLDELDRRPAEFCPADRDALVAARVLRAEERAGCAYVAEVK
jgi:predicted Zn-dependent protease